MGRIRMVIEYRRNNFKIPRGKPDDESWEYLLSVVEELEDLVFDHHYFENAATGEIDTEPDIYYYNFAGYSGKFYFDRNKNIKLIDEAPINISYTTGDFKITTKKGVIYEFNTRESSGTVTCCNFHDSFTKTCPSR